MALSATKTFEMPQIRNTEGKGCRAKRNLLIYVCIYVCMYLFSRSDFLIESEARSAESVSDVASKPKACRRIQISIRVYRYIFGWVHGT